LIDTSTDGGAWWSNRGDAMDTRLTREIDLSSLSEATLRFQAWYDLEKQFDFVYLSASRDGGRTWQVLPGRNTIADRDTGNNYGVGWTGSSGADWVDEEVDLTPFAGSDVLLRFDYVTDQSYNGQGFALRNVSIPELDLDEPGAAEKPGAPKASFASSARSLNAGTCAWSAGPRKAPSSIAGRGPGWLRHLPARPHRHETDARRSPDRPRTLLPGNYQLTLNQ
jgi:bacillopeptidase F (M6 metalloprotease family)